MAGARRNTRITSIIKAWAPVSAIAPALRSNQYAVSYSALSGPLTAQTIIPTPNPLSGPAQPRPSGALAPGAA